MTPATSVPTAFLVALPQDVVKVREALGGTGVHARQAGLSFFKVTSEDHWSRLRRFSQHTRLERYLDHFYLVVGARSGNRHVLYHHLFSAIGKDYERHIDVRRNRRNIAFLLDHVTKQDLIGDAPILDYGCGSGISGSVATSIRLSRPLVGVDTCSVMRRRARTHGLPVLSPRQLERATGLQVAAVVSSYVVHLPQGTEGLDVAWQRLLPSGVFVANCHKGVGAAQVRRLLGRMGGEPVDVKAFDKSHGSYVSFRKVTE
jgi:hypothetical protein